jgi:uncharacterized YigZ family protein
MIRDDYLTILEPGHAQTRVLGSRFLGSALPTNDEGEREQHLDAERKHYHDATHWCFAARFGIEPSILERTSDAGEPKGTAGTPILREIQARGLTNTLVIVTRYFGGTKLGKGNLARAYADCAARTLENAATVQRHMTQSLRVACPYDLQAVVYHVAQEYAAAVEPQSSSEEAMFLVHVRAGAAETFSAVLGEECRGRVRIQMVTP